MKNDLTTTNIRNGNYPGKELALQQRRSQVLELLLENPERTQREIAQIIGCHRNTVARDVEIINRELRASREELFDAQHKHSVKQINEIIDEAKYRLGQLKPNQGARWMEEMLRGIDMRNRMYGLYMPKRYEVRKAVVISKEQADAAVEAALKSGQHTIKIKEIQKQLENDIADDEAIDVEHKEVADLF